MRLVARRIVSTWKDGSWLGEAFLDDDGFGTTNIAIRARVTKQGETLTVDLSESDKQAPSFVNSSYPNMISAVRMAFAFLLDPEVAKNQGAFRPLTVIAREGTIVWAREGAPVTMCTSHCSNEIVEAVTKALANSCPDRATGGWGRRFRVAIKGSDKRRPGRSFVWHLFHARPGGGGSSGGDGWSTAGEWHSAGGLKFGSVEMAEARFPLFFRKHEFRPDSGGDGEHRGGLGTIREYEVLVDDVSFTHRGERHYSAPQGLFGGKEAARARSVIHRRDGTQEEIPSKIVTRLNKGDRVVIETAGGGGYGEPARRSAEARAADRADGKITAAD